MNLAYSLRYLICLMPGLLAIAGSISNPNWHLVNIIWNIVVLVIADWIFTPQRKAPPVYTSSVVPDLILYIASLLHVLSIVLLLWAVFYRQFTTAQWIAAMASVGLNAGISGIVVGHELIHRKKLIERSIGQLNMLVVNYLHFYIEHVRGHHKRVGTAADPATARYGEGLYAFMFRTIPGQWKSALELEADRIRSKGNSEFAYGFRNYVIRALFLQIAILVILYFSMNLFVVVTYIGQSIVAIFLLEYVNYIEHYGLVREEGRKVEPIHAWQSDAPSSRLTLVELSRHADHHIKASKPYHTLESHSISPELNSGYFGMFYIAIIPPLWFSIVHKRMHEAGVQPIQ